MTTRAPRTQWAATTVSADELKLIDDLCQHTGETRSDFLRRAIRAATNDTAAKGISDPDLELRVLRYLNQHK